MSFPTGDLIVGIKVEGIGDRSLTGAGVDSQIRFASGVPTGDTYGLYKPTLLELPPRYRHSWDPQTGRSTVADLDFRLLLDAQTFGWFCNPRPLAQASLAVILEADPLGSNYTTATFNAAYTSKAGTVVWIGREAVYIEATILGSQYAVERGLYGTEAAEHDPASAGADVQVFETIHVLEDRRVELFYVQPGDGYSEEVTVWAGALRELGLAGEGGLTELAISASGISTLLTAAPAGGSEWSGYVGAVLPAPGSRQTRTDHLLVGTYPDWATGERPVPLSLGASPSEGDAFLVAIGEDSAYRAVVVEDAGGVPVYRVDPGGLYAGRPLPSYEEGGGAGFPVREVFVSDPDAPGALLAGDVPTLVLQLLTSTDHGHNGAADVGVDFGLRIPVGMVDTSTFANLATTRGPILQARRFWIGLPGSDTQGELLERIERELLAPYGLGLTVSPTGLLGLVIWEDLPTGYTPTVIGEDQLLDLPRWRGGWDQVVEGIQAEYNRQPGGRTTKLRARAAIQERRRIGSRRDLTTDLGAIRDQADALRVVLELIHRWRQPIPELEVDVHLSALTQVGRLVELTSTAVPTSSAGAASEGVTSAKMIVVGADVDLEGNRATLTLRHLSLDSGRLGRVSATARVKSYGGAGAITVYVNAYVPSGGNGQHDTDADAFEVADYVRLLDQYGAVLDSGLKIASIVSDVITIDSPPAGWGASPPADGDLLVFETYDNVDPSQLERDAFICDNNGLLGAANDDGYAYQN